MLLALVVLERVDLVQLVPVHFHHDLLVLLQLEELGADIRPVVDLPGHLEDLVEAAPLVHEAPEEVILLGGDGLEGGEAGAAENIPCLAS